MIVLYCWPKSLTSLSSIRTVSLLRHGSCMQSARHWLQNNSPILLAFEIGWIFGSGHLTPWQLYLPSTFIGALFCQSMKTSQLKRWTSTILHRLPTSPVIEVGGLHLNCPKFRNYFHFWMTVVTQDLLLLVSVPCWEVTTFPIISVDICMIVAARYHNKNFWLIQEFGWSSHTVTS